MVSDAVFLTHSGSNPGVTNTFVFIFFSFSFPASFKKCVSMQNLIKMYGVVQEL